MFVLLICYMGLLVALLLIVDLLVIACWLGCLLHMFVWLGICVGYLLCITGFELACYCCNLVLVLFFYGFLFTL